MSDSEGEPPSFAAALAHLIQTVHPPDRGPYSYREIAAGTQEQTGAMTASYVQQLATGRQPHPRTHYVEALSTFFGVPPAYFFDDEAQQSIDEQLARLRTYRDQEAVEIAERLLDLGPHGRSTVTNLIDSLRKYEEQPREQRQRRKPRMNSDP